MDAKAILDAVTGVTKKWATQRKAEERRASSEARRREALVPSFRITIKDAAWEVMEEAYLKASNDGHYPAHARQVMYAARPHIQEMAERQLDDQYFCQTLLPDYLIEHPDETADWDVVFDARGHFTEPHTNKVVPLGTIDVRDYLGDVENHSVSEPEITLSKHDRLFPTKGPLHRFSAILFIEKEGFMPLFEKVHLAECYDLAIMSTKGLSVTASRLLVEMLCAEHDIPLLVLHDFDKSGFSIVGTLQRDTRRYEFQHTIKVIDLGLRLPDVEACGLQSESVHYGKSDPSWNLRENGATREEIKFLCEGRAFGYGYAGRRVELNAFTSADLLSWVEGKLKKHGIKKVIPDKDTLEDAYCRALEINLLEKRVEEIAEEVHELAEKAKIPNGLEKKVKDALRFDPSRPWDAVVEELAAKTADEMYESDSDNDD
jgi:hypothetical protein